MLMDRSQINIAKAQIGFIDVFVKPSFQSISELIPMIEKNIVYLSKNKQNWEQRIPEYEKDRLDAMRKSQEFKGKKQLSLKEKRKKKKKIGKALTLKEASDS